MKNLDYSNENKPAKLVKGLLLDIWEKQKKNKNWKFSFRGIYPNLRGFRFSLIPHLNIDVFIPGKTPITRSFDEIIFQLEIKYGLFIVDGWITITRLK